MAVERMRSWDNIGDLAKELGVGRRCLYKWQAKLDHVEPGEETPRTNSHESSYRQQVHRLKRLLAEKTLEVDFFKGALQKVKARRQKSGDSGEMALRPNPRSDATARQLKYRANVRADESQPGQLLSILSQTTACGGSAGSAFCDPEDRDRTPSTLWVSPYFRRVTTARHAGKS